MQPPVHYFITCDIKLLIQNLSLYIFFCYFAGLQDRDVLADVGVHVGGPGKLCHLQLARRGASHQGA